MPKPFLTYEQQIQKLKDKHLVIPNEINAAEELRLNGYFALITGYKSLFKNPTTKDYRDGTTFDDIVALYEFDAQLRELTLRHLLHIERHIRSALFCAAVINEKTFRWRKNCTAIDKEKAAQLQTKMITF